METITPDEARTRFGELVHGPSRTYTEFDDRDGGGIWRPVLVDGKVVSYRLHKLHKGKTVWRNPKRRR